MGGGGLLWPEVTKTNTYDKVKDILIYLHTQVIGQGI